MVLCVDEKSQIQALDRTQPMLPLGLGYVEGVTHDYVRHGTTTLFAALDIASGNVLTQCKKRHRHQEFLAFLRHIDANVPTGMDIHLVVDNYATHKHTKVKNWLAARPHYHVHYTSTYSSWLNQVEIWFNIITQKAIRRGTFRNVKDLINKIQLFVDQYNKNSKPFMWTATADSILAKLKRLCQGIAGTEHYIQTILIPIGRKRYEKDADSYHYRCNAFNLIIGHGCRGQSAEKRLPGHHGNYHLIVIDHIQRRDSVVSGKEKIKHYGIEGSMNINGNSYPVHGSGYANGENFNFALTSTWTAGPHVQVVNVQGTWNLVTGTGTADLSNMGTGTIESIFGNIDLLDCSTYTLSDTTETDERSLESPVGNLGTSLAQ